MTNSIGTIFATTLHMGAVKAPLCNVKFAAKPSFLSLLSKRLLHPLEAGRVSHLESAPVVQQVGCLVTVLVGRDGKEVLRLGCHGTGGKALEYLTVDSCCAGFVMQPQQ